MGMGGIKINFRLLVCCLLFVLVLYTDIRDRIIPNTLTIPAICCGIIFNMWVSGLQGGFFFSSKGIIAGCCMLIIPFVLGGMGGGDVKLLGALGAWLGYTAVLNIFLFGSIAGAFIALGLVFFKKYRLNLMTIFNDIVFFALTKKRVISHGDSGNFPYSIPMAAGFLIYVIALIF